MKVILSGGGTGGHIYPALTIADQIKKLRPDAQIIFVGTQQGLEKNIIPRYGYPLRYIEIAGFKRSLSFDTLRSFGKLFTGLIGANSLISEIKPDLVIGHRRLCMRAGGVFGGSARHSDRNSGAECHAGRHQ